MPRRPMLGQIAALAGSGLLLIFVPFMPTVWGLPRGRVAEMCVFWGGWCLLLFGVEASRSSFVQSCRLGLLSPVQVRIGTYSAASAVLGAVACLVTLSLLLFTSLVGAGIFDDGDNVAHMPSPIRLLVTLPLLPTFLLQAASLGMLKLPAAQMQPASGRRVRPLLLALLFLIGALFAGSLLMFLANRWFALFTVVATWLAQLLFVALSVDHTAFLVAELKLQPARSTQ